MAEGRREWTIVGGSEVDHTIEGPLLAEGERVRVCEVGVSPEEERLRVELENVDLCNGYDVEPRAGEGVVHDEDDAAPVALSVTGQPASPAGGLDREEIEALLESYEGLRADLERAQEALKRIAEYEDLPGSPPADDEMRRIAVEALAEAREREH